MLLYMPVSKMSYDTTSATFWRIPLRYNIVFSQRRLQKLVES